MYADQFYQDAAGGLHFLSALDHANAVSSGMLLPDPTWVAITADQAAAVQDPPLTLAQAQAKQIEMLESAYACAIFQPVTFTTAAGVKKTFQADADSQIVLLKAQQGFAIAGAVPQGFYWLAADNTQVPFALADLKGLYSAMLAQGWAAFQHLQVQKAAVRAATTTSGVIAVTW
ncbi:DUF4376 domain-containing protein [Ralstonia sp. Ralssp135]|uniref:DUF4376 domain-containing protein n=1 Tax=Ralstonia sp. Ralssp135 TaxID=3243016 RepID=UPI0039AEE0BF